MKGERAEKPDSANMGFVLHKREGKKKRAAFDLFSELFPGYLISPVKVTRANISLKHKKVSFRTGVLFVLFLEVFYKSKMPKITFMITNKMLM